MNQLIVDKNETLTSFDRRMRIRARGVAFENALAFDLYEMSVNDYIICHFVAGKLEVSSSDNSRIIFIMIVGRLVDGEGESGC